MLSREVCAKCYAFHYDGARDYAGYEKWWVCFAKPYENNHAINVDDPIPERCPFKFEQGVMAGMTNVK